MPARYLHTMLRITDPDRSRAFYEALGFSFERDMDIVRDGELEATNYFFSMGDHTSVLELTFNHDGSSYDLGTGYGHIAIGVDDLDATLARLAEQGIEPERPPYSVREGGNRICFVRDPDSYRVAHGRSGPARMPLALWGATQQKRMGGEWRLVCSFCGRGSARR